MNEKLSRPQFNQMGTTEKQTLMESLAARYNMTFLDLHTFDRWGQSCTTGIFKKDGREFVFVPGDTVTLGWEQFAVGLNQESREELEYLFREWEMEPQNPEEMIRESMAPVRQAAIGPMLVGRELEEINWEPVKMDDPRLTVHPDWLKEFRDFAWSDSSSLTLHQSARIERTEKGFQICIYNHTDYDALLAMLENRGFSLPTADEWAYLCGGGCRTLFPWGDGLDYSCVCTGLRTWMRMRTGPMTWRSPTSSACPSPTIPICGKWCRLIGLPPAAVTADAISAVGWAHFSVSYPVRPTVSQKCRRTMN